MLKGSACVSAVTPELPAAPTVCAGQLIVVPTKSAVQTVLQACVITKRVGQSGFLVDAFADGDQRMGSTAGEGGCMGEW